MMTDKKIGYRVGIFDSTSLKGDELKQTMIKRGFPYASVRLIDSGDKIGILTSFDDEASFISIADDEALRESDVIFFCGNPPAAGGLVTRHNEMDFFAFDLSGSRTAPEDRIYIVSGVNDLSAKDHKGIYTSPNSAAVPMIRFLKILNDKFQIRFAAATVMTAVSEDGYDGIKNLHDQTTDLLNFKSLKGKQLPFNMFPRFKEYSETVEDITSQVISLSGLSKGSFTLSLFDIPIFYGTVASICIETEEKMTKSFDWKNLFSSEVSFRWEGILSGGASPLGPIDIGESDDLHIQIMQIDPGNNKRAWFWLLADNIRFGAVLNILKVAESILELK